MRPNPEWLSVIFAGVSGLLVVEHLFIVGFPHWLAVSNWDLDDIQLFVSLTRTIAFFKIEFGFEEAKNLSK